VAMVEDDPTFNRAISQQRHKCDLECLLISRGSEYPKGGLLADGKGQMSRIVPPHITWSPEGCNRDASNRQEVIFSMRK
jgi:hypothetical protein